VPTTDASGRLAIYGGGLARFARDLAEPDDPVDGRAVAGHLMRNRFRGLVSRVFRDGREAADELGLEPGVLAITAIKAANVSIEIPSIR
jgi:hypothetical protein